MRTRTMFIVLLAAMLPYLGPAQTFALDLGMAASRQVKR